MMSETKKLKSTNLKVKFVLSRADILLLADVYGRRMHNGINGFCKRDLAAHLLFVRYRLFV